MAALRSKSDKISLLPMAVEGNIKFREIFVTNLVINYDKYLSQNWL